MVVTMTECSYEVLLGFPNELDDKSTKLYTMSEVADFMLKHNRGYIGEADGTPILEFCDGEIFDCSDIPFRDELMQTLRKSEGFEDRYSY